MAELRVGGRPAEPVTDRPWDLPLQLAWTRPEERPRRVRFAGTPLESPTSPLVLPWVEARLEWEDAAGGGSVQVRVAEGSRPEPARLEVLRGFARAVRRLGALDLTAISNVPLFSITQLWRWLEPSPLDDLIDKTLGTLAEASARPRSWLREERVVQPVGRVRRPSRDAIRHLSRHPEHAGTDGVRIYPERILASVHEEELDLYDNRVLIGLIRRLLKRAHTNRQRVDLALAELDRLREDIDRTYRFGQYKRWGALRKALNGQDGELTDVLRGGEAVKRRFAQQIRTLEACLQSAVGQQLRFVPLPTTPLRETNILTWDPRYRGLPLLWTALDAEEAKARAPIDPVLDDPDRSWLDFCHLALLRALVELGFSGAGPISSQILGDEYPAETLRLPNPNGDWVADVQVRGRAVVLGLQRDRPVQERAGAQAEKGPGQIHADRGARRPARRELRFVPTFCGPEDRPAAAGPDDVWLHPHPLADLKAGTWAQGRRRAWIHARHPKAIAVAPWSFGSVDRLGRLLQVLTLGAELVAGEIRDRCPCCSGPSIAGREPSDRECTSGECGARWGYRTCSPGCGTRVPKLVPRVPNEEHLLELVFDHSEPHRRLLLAEQLGGRDLLADWCLDDEGIGRFWMVCPACGRCGNPRCTSSGCRGA